ncbi:hypothetical protein [uncultured Aliiroseovarius sp.]|uniref:hypothetical protein n=1 Tax=uncultured Aliiroseovarius sp. TaxID=1658783 RepID=UPI00260F8C2D|nr:hypothetical protein [uncultured Aliiroseovarius sp.]
MIDMTNRIRFDHATQVMEVDFTTLRLGNSADVNAAYDQILTAISATGEDKWFMLLDVTGMRVDSFAWTAQRQRGKALSKAHSQGIVKVDASDITRAELARTAGTDAFNPNLFTTRDAALARLAQLPSQRLRKLDRTAQYDASDISERLVLDTETRVAEIDLSGLTLRHSGDVDVVYGTLAAALEDTGRKWFFLINTAHLRVEQDAWLSQSRAAKRLRLSYALGQVGYGMADVTAQDRTQVVSMRPASPKDRSAALAELDALRTKVA